ncbi:hypothetical protein M9458_053679 [Cirrhinus mrigala]|uniref:Ig-like domain-containing protein n=1 Tax=Cirrhinus mrigala TaxID=683832 RepID=A0ABD0MQD8_CIRMR
MLSVTFICNKMCSDVCSVSSLLSRYSAVFSGVTPPKVSILPPSSAEISSKSTATLVCVASGGFPSDWSLSLKVDGSSIRSQDSSAGLLQEDGLYSWSSSLTLSEQQWMESVSVSCEATRSGQPAVTRQLTRDQCSQ